MKRLAFSLSLVLLLGLWPIASMAQVTVSGSGSTITVQNDPTTGTIRNCLAKITSTGAIRSTTADSAIPLYVVVGGEGTNAQIPAVLAVSGVVSLTMDATVSNTRGMYVVQSATQPCQGHPQAAEPTNGMVIGVMTDNATTAGQTALVSAQLIAFKPGSGSVSANVGLTMPSEFTVSGSPVVGSGTLVVTEATQAANLVYASPTSGGAAAPNFRGLVAADLPAGTASGACGGDLGGTFPNCTVLQASGLFALPGDVTPTALSGDVNDYAGCAGTAICRLNGGVADRIITGFAGGTDGRILNVCNVGTTNKLTLPDQSTSSSATNRLLAGASMTLRPNVCKPLWYDSTSARWRPWDSGLLDPLLVRTCDIPFGSTDASAPPLSDTDDVTYTCLNNTGLDWKITAVSVYSNAGSPAFTPILNGGAANSILTGACTAAAGVLTACTVNGSPLVKSLSANGATCSSPPCGIDANISSSGGVSTYGYIHVVGVLQ